MEVNLELILVANNYTFTVPSIHIFNKLFSLSIFFSLLCVVQGMKLFDIDLNRVRLPLLRIGDYL